MYVENVVSYKVYKACIHATDNHIKNMKITL